MMYLIQTARTKVSQGQAVLQTLALLASYGIVFAAAFFLQADYGLNGIVLILLMFIFHGNRASVAIVDVMMNLLMGGNIQYAGALSAIPISFYNGKKGISLKYFFYAIYPLHLLLFYWIKNFML